MNMTQEVDGTGTPRIICNECAKAEQKSQVHLSPMPVYDMAYTAYFDENGYFHAHNPNGLGYTYECTNGHLWRPVRECPNCDWTDC